MGIERRAQATRFRVEFAPHALSVAEPLLPIAP